MTETVWACDPSGDPSLIIGFWSELFEWPLEKIQLFNWDYSLGFIKDLGLFPKLFKSTDGEIRRLPPIFNAGGLIVISERAAAVLRQFDLGEADLLPTTFTQPDGKTEISDGPYFVLNLGSHKKAFSPDHSLAIRPAIGSKGPDHIWRVSASLRDDLLAVTKAAFGGADLWMDPCLPDIIFVSESLHAALKKKKLDRAFGLFKCRVVEG